MHVSSELLKKIRSRCAGADFKKEACHNHFITLLELSVYLVQAGEWKYLLEHDVRTERRIGVDILEHPGYGVMDHAMIMDERCEISAYDREMHRSRKIEREIFHGLAVLLDVVDKRR